MARLKSVDKRIMWAYFTSRGDCVLNTIAGTRTISRQLIENDLYNYKHYENLGWVCKAISVTIHPLSYSTNSK